MSTFLFVLCCQNDDNANNHYQSHTTLASDNTKQLITVKAETIPHILDFIAHEQKGFLPQLEPHTRHLDTNNPFGTIDTSIIKALEDLQGNRVYTFKIIPFTPSNGIFYNLIVVTDYDANIIKSYIKSYESFENKKIGVDFNGKVSKYSLDGTLVNDIVFYQGKANGPDCTPCEDVTDDTDTNNHGGSTSGDPDDTTNDPTDTDTDSTSSTSGGGGSSSASSGSGSASSSASNTSNSGTGGENISITIIPCPCEGHSLEEPCTCHTPPTIIIDIGAALNHKNAASAIPLPCCEEDVAVIDNTNPCDELNKLWEVENLKDQIQTLKSQNIVNNDNYLMENGFKIFISTNGNLNISSIQVGPENGNFNYGATSNSIGGVHTHPSVRFPMFSVNDILNLKQFSDNIVNSPVSILSETPVHILVSNQGVYALKIENPILFAIYYNSFLNGFSNLKNERRKLESKYVRYMNQTTGQQGNSNDHKLAFLSYVKHIGVNLYQANDDLTNWTKFEISEDNTNLISTPCE